jgi:4-amino-4-deoxy-L-arabinose transferase-like glycosyltransferase
VLAAPWYLIAEQKTPGFLQYFLIGEHFERFLVTGWTGDLYGVARAQPHGMIWLIGVLGFLPWSFFFIRPLLRIRSVAARFRADASGWGSYLLLWMLSPLLIFTAANNIIVPYVLPGIPAAAVLLVQSWIDSDRTGTCIGRGSVNGFKAISAGFLATIAIAAIAFATSPEIVSTKSQKRLVAAASGIAPPDAGRLVYWQYHFFSAEFYSAGKSAQIKSFAALDALFTDRRRDFLAVRADGLRQIPQSYMSHFTQVGVFGRFHLFFENPLGGRAP